VRLRRGIGDLKGDQMGMIIGIRKMYRKVAGSCKWQMQQPPLSRRKGCPAIRDVPPSQMHAHNA
jgi:hypothetical protein